MKSRPEPLQIKMANNKMLSITRDLHEGFWSVLVFKTGNFDINSGERRVSHIDDMVEAIKLLVFPAYNAKYDSYYYADTGEWIEEKCDDPECEYCANRPDNAIKEIEK